MLTLGRYYSYFWWHNSDRNTYGTFLLLFSFFVWSETEWGSNNKCFNYNLKGLHVEKYYSMWCGAVYLCMYCIAHVYPTSDVTSEQIKNGKRNLLGAQWKLNEDRATRRREKKKTPKNTHRTIASEHCAHTTPHTEIHTFKISVVYANQKPAFPLKIPSKAHTQALFIVHEERQQQQ